MRWAFSVCFALVTTVAGPCYGAPDADAWLPIKRSQIEQLAASAVDGEAFTVRTLDVSSAKLGGSLPDDDTIWVMTNRTLGIAMAGKGDGIRALRVTVPVVNYSMAQGERVFAFLSALLEAVYPNWSDAGKWPQVSMKEAWEKSPLVTGSMPANANDLLVQRSFDGIVSATFGVPPDIVVYAITTRAQCVPDLARGNPFQRVLC
jgi:hypothetical protein